MDNQQNVNEDPPTMRGPAAQKKRPPLNTFAQRIQGELSLPELWQLLLKRKSTFFLCFGAATVIALVTSLILPARYEGVGLVMLDFDSNALQDAFENASGGGDSDNPKLQTQVKVLETDALSWEVIKRLRLDQRPEAAHRRFLIGPIVCLSSESQAIATITPECRNVLLEEFHRRLKVQALARTQVIEIRYRSRSRELAAQSCQHDG